MFENAKATKVKESSESTNGEDHVYNNTFESSLTYNNYEVYSLQKNLILNNSDEKTEYVKTRGEGTGHQGRSLKKFVKWSPEEDERLKEAVMKNNAKNWKKIAEEMKIRSPIQCLHRWSKILKPGLIKGPWTVQEDRKLLEWVSKEGPCQWTKCANKIFGRSGKQCRERYLNILNPTVKKGSWTIVEDYKIFKLYNQFGSKWSHISAALPGRPENSVKNRFYSTLRKYFNQNKKEPEPCSQNISLQLSEKKSPILNVSGQPSVGANSSGFKSTKKLNINELLTIFPQVLEELTKEYKEHLKITNGVFDVQETKGVTKVETEKKVTLERIKKKKIIRPIKVAKSNEQVTLEVKPIKDILLNKSTDKNEKTLNIKDLKDKDLNSLSKMINNYCDEISFRDVHFEHVDAEVDKILEKIVAGDFAEDDENLKNCFLCIDDNHSKLLNDGQTKQVNKDTIPSIQQFNSSTQTTNTNSPLNKMPNKEPSTDLKKIVNELNNLELLFLNTKNELQNYDSNNAYNSSFNNYQTITSYKYGINYYGNLQGMNNVDYNTSFSNGIDNYNTFNNMSLNMNFNTNYNNNFLYGVGSNISNIYNYETLFKF